MSDLTNFMENQVAIFLAGDAPTVGVGRFACLFTADPGETGDFTDEVSEAGYARQLMAMTATGDTADNDDVLTFTNNGAQVTVTHYGVADAAAGGNLLWSKAVDNARVWPSGDLTAAAGAFSVTPA
jgi:hypothetical protein